MAFGPALGLQMVDTLLADSSLSEYHLLPAVRGDLLAKLGRHAEASQEFERAASLTRNARERDVLLARAAKPWEVGVNLGGFPHRRSKPSRLLIQALAACQRLECRAGRNVVGMG